MIIQNIVDDFYRKLVPRKTVLILAGLDVDSLCALRSLIQLLQKDYIPFSLKPIRSKHHLFKTISEHKGKCDQFVLINLGATVDFLNIDEDGETMDNGGDEQNPLINDHDELELFIIDSHRPVNLINIFADQSVGSSKIYVHIRDEEIDNIPVYEEVFSSDDEDEDEDNDLYDNIARQQEKENRRKKRTQTIEQYEEHTFTGPSSALVLFELSRLLSKDSIEGLWWGIVGMTDQWISKKILNSQYTDNVWKFSLHDHSMRLQARQEHSNHEVLRVEFNDDMYLPLYRHWTIQEALLHSLPITSSIKVWTNQGSKKIKELIALMGLPLSQSNEQYHYMEQKYKDDFMKLLDEKAPAFGIKNLKMVSFSAQRGYGYKYTATDVAVAVNAILELSGRKDPELNFHTAMEALRVDRMKEVLSGIELGKKQLRAVMNTINSNIEMGTVINAGPFLYMLLKEGNPEHHMFSHPSSIRLLATYLLNAFCRSQRKQSREKIRRLPLLVATPRGEHGSGVAMLAGIPPLATDSNKNPFGKAFMNSELKSNARVNWIFMDQSLIEIATSDLPKFLDALVIELDR
jgi:cell division control protein 45